MVQLARLGDFRAIAYWLNASLVPQGIYARVAADRPGVLLVLLEFVRLPRRDRLNHLVCHRLCRLNSQVIRGVRILAQFADSDDILWDTSIRLLAPARRSTVRPSSRRSRPRRRPAARPMQAERRPIHPVQAPPSQQRADNLRRIQSLLADHSEPQALPSARPMAALPAARSPRSVAALPPARQPEANARRSQRRRRVTPRPPALRLTPRFLQRIGSAAVAVFLMGLGVETWKHLDAGTVLSDWFNNRTSIRTASGRVPVIEGGQNSNNPIVTLTFAGGVPPSQASSTPSTTTSAPAQPASTTESQEATDQATNGQPPDSSSTDRRTTPSAENPIPLAERPLPRSDVMLANLNRPLALTDTDTTAANPFKATENASIRLVNVSGEAVAGSGSNDLVQTLDSLRQAGLHPVGAGRNRQEARLPEIVEVRGKRIAYLSYSQADEFAAGRWRPGSNPALQEAIAEDIQTIRNQVDWVVVNYHWNQQLSSYPENWQMQLARSAIDQGADLVVGYHPEALQGAEIYKGRVIAYSLGNFIFANQNQPAQTNFDSAVLKVSLKDDRMRLEFIPVEVQGDEAAIATGQKAKDILSYIDSSSALFEQPMKSPTILDRLALDPNQPAPASEFNPPSETETKAPPAAGSFITYPNGEQSTPVTPQATPTQPDTATPTPNAAPAADDLESRESSPEQSYQAPPTETSEATNPSSRLPEAGSGEEALDTEETTSDAVPSKGLEPEAWTGMDAAPEGSEEPANDLNNLNDAEATTPSPDTEPVP